MAHYFNKYDHVNLGGCETNPTIHDGVDDAFIEASDGDNGFPTSDNKDSDDKREDDNDPMEARGTTMNIKDPIGIAINTLLR